MTNNKKAVAKINWKLHVTACFLLAMSVAYAAVTIFVDKPVEQLQLPPMIADVYYWIASFFIVGVGLVVIIWATDLWKNRSTYDSGA